MTEAEEIPAAKFPPQQDSPQTTFTFKEISTAFIFELLGTGLFAYGIVCSQSDTQNKDGGDALVSAYLFAAIFLTCKFTGGHVNPVVSYSFYMNGELEWYMLKVYTAAQFTGAFLGALLAFSLFALRAAKASENTSFDWMLADIAGEALGTFVFILFIHIQVHEDTKITNNDVAGIGLIASALYIGRALTTHTGGCLNPALGVSIQLFMYILEGDSVRLASIWLYLLGPLLGSYFAQMFYAQIYYPLRTSYMTQVIKKPPKLKEVLGNK